MKIFLTIFFNFIFGATSLHSQGSPAYIVPEEVSQEYRKGEQALLLKDYEKALKIFKKVLKRNHDFIPALRGAGACYELLNDYDNASKLYEEALSINPRFSRALYYETANAHFKSGNYFMALELFMEFDTLQHLKIADFSYNGLAEQQTEKEYYDKLERNLRGCHVAMDSIKFLNIASVFNLGEAINTDGDEYFPFLSNNQKLMFYTGRKTQSHDEDLYFSTNPTGKWRIGQKSSNQFNTAANEGMTTLVRDGRKMFYTACNRKEVLGPCDIWEADVFNEKITDTKNIVGYINSGSWDSQASVSCDGSILYFASDRDGGFGGVDIWVSKKLADGRWGKPENVGENINTEGDEEAPFITNDGNTLYFSSTGHLGLGEQDIFMSRKEEDEIWTYPINLGMPVNSSYRELGFFLSADGFTGYFSSNRKGGYGGMDIYKFDLSEQLYTEPITFVEGFVLDSILKTPLAKTTIHFKNRIPIETDDDGRFFLCVPAYDVLDFEIKHLDYHPYKRKKQIPEWHNKSFYNLNILLDPLFRLPVFSGPLEVETTDPEIKPHVFLTELRHTVLFDFDKAALKPQTIERVDEFLNKVFDGNQLVQKVEIIGFSDDIGADAYNLILSEKRAKEVGVFLKEKGIRVDKIFIEGRGEMNGNNPKWANRKVEIVVSIQDK